MPEAAKHNQAPPTEVRALDQLREMSVVVADTGDPDALRTYAPVDCTTNPSIVLAALKTAVFSSLLDDEIERGSKTGASAEDIAAGITVAVGVELMKLVPGRVSTEVEAHLSFDTEASIRRARSIVEDYAARGVDSGRILIKLAATWEGIRAAERLQREGIDCNLTLIFSLTQAVACADAGVFLISPFVGRITDWHKKDQGVDGFAIENDPGVLSVVRCQSFSECFGCIVTEALVRFLFQFRRQRIGAASGVF